MFSFWWFSEKRADFRASEWVDDLVFNHKELDDRHVDNEFLKDRRYDLWILKIHGRSLNPWRSWRSEDLEEDQRIIGSPDSWKKDYKLVPEKKVTFMIAARGPRKTFYDFENWLWTKFLIFMVFHYGYLSWRKDKRIDWNRNEEVWRILKPTWRIFREEIESEDCLRC